MRSFQRPRADFRRFFALAGGLSKGDEKEQSTTDYSSNDERTQKCPVSYKDHIELCLKWDDDADERNCGDYVCEGSAYL